MIVRMDVTPVSALLKRLGLTKDGGAQMFLTQTINRRITRYMPAQSGVLSTKLKYIKNSKEIQVLGNYAKYQYYGKVMVDPKTGAAGFRTKDGQWRSRRGVPKVLTDRNLDYSKGKNQLAGPFWDRALMAAEGGQIAKEVAAYMEKRGRK